MALKYILVIIEPPKIFPNNRKEIESTEANLLITCKGAIKKKGEK